MKNKNIIKADTELLDELVGSYSFSNTYYNSLDFIYKYIKEVILRDIFGVKKNFFKKYITSIEDHRYARENSIDTGSLYNTIYPMAAILVNQDFSGAGPRNKMSSANLLNIMPSELTMPTIFQEYNMSIQLSYNLYKYNVTLIAKFNTPFAASNFVSKLYNNIHINKHYYPSYSELRYRIDQNIYNYIREMYKSKYATDEEFLAYMNRHTNRKIIREFDRATGNVSYFLLLNVRPLVLIQTPAQSDDNNPGNRESSVSINMDIEIDLPSTLYFSAPINLLRKLNMSFYNGIRIKDENDPIIQEHKKEINKDDKIDLVRSDDGINVNKIVTMPKVDVSRIEEIHNKEKKYSTTISISELTDLITIDDKTIINYLRDQKGNVIKIFDENADEIIPTEVRIFDDSIDIMIDGSLEDTIVLVEIYG